MQKIRKAVIPVGGLGTRFLPATKAMPKEMLPIIDKPVIQYIVEEAVASGITEIILVTGSGKRAIEDHFDHNFELAYNLEDRGKKEILKMVQEIEGLAEFVYVRQPRPLGDGHALLCAKNIVGDEPFAVLFGDDIIDNHKPALAQLISAYEETGSPILCLKEIEGEDISNYGVVETKDKGTNLIEVLGLVEKPAFQDAPSNLGVIGKYIVTPDVLDYLGKTEVGSHDGEIRLIDGFKSRLKDGGHIYGLQIEGTRYDTGSKLGLLQANIAYAMKRPELRDDLKKFIASL